MLINIVRHRTVEARIGGARLKATVSNGCPQGGVLSPLLWSMVVDVTGAIKTAPTAALEVMLSLPPLPLYIKAEACLAALRLRSAGTWKIIEPGAVTLFTDGSCVEGSSGAGYHCLELQLSGSVSLGHYTTVFQAEVAAITLGTQRLLEAGIEGRKIQIFSDSRAAILSISGWRSRSALVAECQEVLELTFRQCEVDLYWVPGHQGIEGNEEADRLAVEGAGVDFVGPEPVVGLSSQMRKSIILEDMIKAHQA
ncbi:uncharacterized protein LOC129808865 [Phlebotomus papatasi]|uniref:uncharacterized protein LOC129808865 n=1 Tax=Phlebotomus papatasi TaxID=29031 RepID=UPI0024845139|nr:uncharacterized protein LOC129808865 [Phlebotomus papatasi]